MDTRKDLFVHKPLVSIPSKLEQEMYEQMTILNKQIKAIKQILEVCNEK